MELEIGPFDAALHIRSSDHLEAVRREAKLLSLDAEAPPHRYDRVVARLLQEFPSTRSNEAAEAAYLSGAPSFTVRFQLPDEMVGSALVACDELDELLEHLDRWARHSELALLEAPPDVAAYRRAYLAQVRVQLRAAQSASRQNVDSASGDKSHDDQ